MHGQLLSKPCNELPLQSRVPDSKNFGKTSTALSVGFALQCCGRESLRIRLLVMAAKAQCALQVGEKVVYEYVSAPLNFGKPPSSAEEPDLGQDEAGPSGLGLGAEGATRGGLGSVGGIGWALHLLCGHTTLFPRLCGSRRVPSVALC